MIYLVWQIYISFDAPDLSGSHLVMATLDKEAAIAYVKQVSAGLRTRQRGPYNLSYRVDEVEPGKDYTGGLSGYLDPTVVYREDVWPMKSIAD